MPLEIIDCTQNSQKWHEARTGVATASSFQDVLSKGGGKTRRSYMLKLASERIRGESADSFSNIYTDRGHEFEDVAKDLYTQQTGNKVVICGFMKDVYGYSPDGLVDDDGLIEIKTKSGHLQIDLLLSGDVPSEHLAQIQGGLMVSGRKWVDFISYCPGLPIFIKRVERDEQYITNLRIELALFEKELQEIVEQILTKF
jgi:predicted phage-related endonuclease